MREDTYSDLEDQLLAAVVSHQTVENGGKGLGIEFHYTNSSVPSSKTS